MNERIYKFVISLALVPVFILVGGIVALIGIMLAGGSVFLPLVALIAPEVITLDEKE